MTAKAKKFDQGKVPLNLVPWGPVWEIARVLEFGAGIHGEYNWTEGFTYNRLFAATMRHLTKWVSGVDLDKESGLSHLAHAACNLFFLMAYQAQGRDDLDDRFKGFEALFKED